MLVPCKILAHPKIGVIVDIVVVNFISVTIIVLYCIVSSCVIFSRKHRVSVQSLHRNMKFTHIFGKFTHTFPKTIETYLFMHFIFNKKRTQIINADIYAVLLLAKKVTIYTFLVCKIFGIKKRSCKIFDKFQVCLHHFAPSFTRVCHSMPEYA